VFEHACKPGFEGIASKKDSPYRSGRSPDWIKPKNPKGAGGEAGSRRVASSARPCLLHRYRAR
jgi:hypothetical protein